MAQQALFLPAPITLGAVGAFVMVLFTLGDANLHLYLAAVIEIHHQRDQGHTLTLGIRPKTRQFFAFNQ